jgi:hypothetical protein
MPNDVRHTKRNLPVSVMIANVETLVSATADVYRTPETVLIQITSNRSDGQMLAEFLEQEGPIGLSFSAVPVPRANREKRDTN